MTKQEKILKFLQKMYDQNFLNEKISLMENSYKYIGGIRETERVLLEELKKNSSHYLQILHEKYLPVYDRLYSEEHIDKMYEYYSSKTHEFDMTIQTQLSLELMSAEISWINTAANDMFLTTGKNIMANIPDSKNMS